MVALSSKIVTKQEGIFGYRFMGITIIDPIIAYDVASGIRLDGDTMTRTLER
jgi:hypothetical protein